MEPPPARSSVPRVASENYPREQAMPDERGVFGPFPHWESQYLSAGTPAHTGILLSPTPQLSLLKGVRPSRSRA